MSDGAMEDRALRQFHPHDDTPLTGERNETLPDFPEAPFSGGEHTYRVILAAFASTSLIPYILILLDSFLGEYDLILNCLPAAIAMPLMTLYLRVSKNIRVMKPVTLLTAWVGFFCTVYARGAWDIYLVILFSFIPLAFLLYGSRGGKIWSLCFIASVLASWLLGESHVFPRWIPLVNRNDIVFHMFGLGIVYLITSSMQKESESRTRQLIDSVVRDLKTGLPTKEIMQEHIPHNGMAAILQIENHRELSTIFGYDISERVLIFVAGELTRIRAIIPFTLYRLMGSEFGICVSSRKRMNPGQAKNILSFIIRELQKARLNWNDIGICLSYRTGGAIIDEGKAGDAISHASIALATGIRFRRSVTIYEEHNGERESALQSLSRYNTLHENITQKRLKMYIQPVVSTFSGKILWYESLLRIRREDGVYESVFPYLSIARTTGQYPHFTHYMLSQAEALLLRSDFDISVNIGLCDILDVDIVSRILSVAGNAANRPGKLILEILESEDLVEIEACKRFFVKARSLGCRIAIDDFGSGYANFVNLLQSGADIVKIDGSLILRMEHDAEARLLVASIAEFCAGAGKKTVAEFVENETIHGVAREIGIDYCQGYYFGAPFECTSDTRIPQPLDKCPKRVYHATQYTGSSVF